jgi:hypothetical protein
MQDIGQLILGDKAPPPAGTSKDQFRLENLRPDQVQSALTSFERMGENPRLLEKVLSSPENFNSYPIEVRRKFFSVVGPSPMQQTSMSGDAVGDLILGKPTAPQATSQAASETVPTRKVGKVKDQTGSATKLGRAAASLYDITLGGIAPAIIEPITYAGARAFGQAPEQAKQTSTAAATPFEQPMGRLFGITETPEYKGEAGRQAQEFVGEYFQKGAQALAEKTGMPVQDVENMAGTMLAAIGIKTAPAVQRGIVSGAEKVETALGTAQPTPPVAPRVEPALAGKPRVSYAEFQAQLEARKAGAAAPVLPPSSGPNTATMPAPTLTQPFPEVKYAPKGMVNLPEQEARKQLLARVGLEKARQSSVEGNGFAAANEYQTAKVDAPVGQLYRDTFTNERATLENFGQRMVEKTGGTLGLDEDTVYARGTTITRPFDEFKGLLQNQMNQAYEQAKQVAGTQPAVNPTNLQKFLNTDSNFTVNDSFMSLRRGIESHLRENDLIGPDGRVKPMTVEQAENLRKYINSNWNNERSGIIGRLKDKIDNDVTKVAGEDVYKAARDIRTKIARLLDDPKGVSKIMDYDPQSPMNRAVPFEKIASTVERMSVDQLNHLIKTLKDMPDEVRPQANAAIAEIKAQFANRILQEGSKTKGEWGAQNITKYLNDNSRKLGVLMGDRAIAQMVKDLHDAGHVLKKDTSYPGAAIQAHNLIRLGAVPLLGTLGTSVGGAVGGALGGFPGAGVGATVGGMMGAQRGVKMAEKSAVTRAQKKMVPLKDIAKPPMRIDIRGVGGPPEKD